MVADKDPGEEGSFDPPVESLDFKITRDSGICGVGITAISFGRGYKSDIVSESLVNQGSKAPSILQGICYSCLFESQTKNLPERMLFVTFATFTHLRGA